VSTKDSPPLPSSSGSPEPSGSSRPSLSSEPSRSSSPAPNLTSGPPTGGDRAWPFRFRRVPNARRARQWRSRETRDGLVRAAEALIREKGLAAATVRAIAKRARVSVGTVYRRFDNKAALIRAVCDRSVERTHWRVSRLRPELRRRASLEDVATRFVNGALVQIERDRNLLLAFADDDRSERVIHAALSALLRSLAPRAAPVEGALDLALMTLRAWTLRPALPSGSRPSRPLLTARLTRVVRQPLGL
jgi:AcrR family transcriptional regulator